jgi:hypothetical protein
MAGIVTVSNVVPKAIKAGINAHVTAQAIKYNTH